MRKSLDHFVRYASGGGPALLMFAAFLVTFVTVSAAMRLFGGWAETDTVVVKSMHTSPVVIEEATARVADNSSVTGALTAPPAAVRVDDGPDNVVAAMKTETPAAASSFTPDAPEDEPTTANQAMSEAGSRPENKSLQLEEGEQELPPFSVWLAALWADAQAKGVSRATFERATAGVEPEMSLPDLVFPGRDRHSAASGQAEFVKSPEAYLSERSFKRLAAEGREKLDQHGQLLQAIEEKYGVSRYVVLAIWGRESNFGAETFKQSAIRALATQAYAGRRRAQFREELLIALTLLERRVVELEEMRGSWAGAMGQTQFMPSDYDKYAVDQDGDGRPNPWSSLPDALASAANQLARNGWLAKARWGYEVTVKKSFDCTLATPEIKRPVEEWSGQGVRLANSKNWGEETRGLQTSMLMPAGDYGPSFLTTQNFLAIKAYNASELYALFVGHLSDRIAGGKTFAKPWAKVTQTGSRDVEALQVKLKELGVYNDKIDGKAGSRTRAAVGAYQRMKDLPQDCWPGPSVVSHVAKLAAR